MHKRIFVIAITIVFVFSMLACGKKETVETQPSQPAEPTVVGVWSCEVDLTDEVDSLLCAQLDVEHICTHFPFVLYLSVFEDGTYSLGYDQEFLSAQLDGLGNALWQMVVDQAAAENGVSEVAASSILQEQGKNRGTLIQELNLTSVFENNFSQTGFWKLDNDALYFAQEEDAFIEEDAIPVEISLDQLVLMCPAGMDEANEPIANKFVWNKK